MNLYPLFKYFAFKKDPEAIHESSIEIFKTFPNLATLFAGSKPSEKYRINDGHMCWDFPIGLAAGFDKNAQAIKFFSKCGFGSVEVGTVTKEPQVGNERPRIWRIPELKSLRNAMGFPNAGANAIKQNIQNPTFTTCLGVNIGKNKHTTLADTPSEYAYLYELFAPLCDYLVINISSPNTPGLRDLQTKESFKAICEAIDEKRQQKYRPLYLKIAPDLAKSDILDLVDLAKEFSLSGIIATNTTSQHHYDRGGVSGQYIKEISKNVRKIVCQAASEVKELSVIGVGGIDTTEEIIEFWKDGGSFVQIYSSFVYEGPSILRRFQNDFDKLIAQENVSNLQEYLELLRKSH